MLAAHLRPLSLGVLLGCDGDARNGDFLRDDWVDAAGKTDLDRAAHLPAVEGRFDERDHHRAERADVVILAAHIVPDFAVDIGVVFFADLLFVDSEGFVRALVADVERHVVLDVDAVAGLVFLYGLHIVADFALEAHVGDDAVAGLRVDARHIARVGVAVGVAVLHVKQNHKFIPVLDWVAHHASSF